MTDSEIDELGPVDYVVVEFPAEKANFSGEMAAELSAAEAVRPLDVCVEVGIAGGRTGCRTAAAADEVAAAIEADEAAMAEGV